MGWRNEEKDRQRKGFNKNQTLLSRIQSKLICGNTDSYDLVDQETISSNSSGCLLCPFRKHRALSSDQKFYISLYKEGLLVPGIAPEEENASISIEKAIQTVSEFPVLNICHGFYDYDLSIDRHCGKAVLSTANFRYSPSCDPNPWIRVGLDKILFSSRSQYEGLMVNGIPASTWMDIVEPVLQTLILIRKIGRGNRTNITKLKKPSPLHRNRLVVVGDVQSQYFMIGPHIEHYRENRFGIMALFAYRRAELGARTWRIPSRYIINTQRVIPCLRETRESTRNKPHKRVTTPSSRSLDLHRSKSDSDIVAERERRKNSKLYQEAVPTPSQHETNRNRIRTIALH